MSIYDKASLVLIPSGTKTSKVYSQVPVNGDGDFTFSRSTAATRVNADGNIEKETQNLLLQSNSFDTTWTKTNTSVTDGQSGYDGTNNAYLLTKSAANARINQAINNDGVQTFSVYVKAGTLDFVLLNNGLVSQWFDLSNGSVAYNSSASNTIDAKIEDVGNGWYRCSLTFSSTISVVRIYPSQANADVSGTSGNIYIQDAQLEQGLVARDVITTTTAAVEGGITDNVPRLDYTDSSCPALLLEPQRTNDLPQSEYIYAGGGYSFTGSTSVTYNAATSPEGKDNAALFDIPYNNAGFYNFATGGSKSVGDKITLSVFAKLKSGSASNVVALGYGGVAVGGDRLSEFNLSTGTITYSHPSADSVSIEDYGNGWYRLIQTQTCSAAGSAGAVMYGRAEMDVYIWGVQSEAGSYATSYIPTYGTSVSRVKDFAVTSSSITLATKNFTIFVDSKKMNLSGAGGLQILYKTGGGNVFMYGNCIGWAGESGTEYYCSGNLLGDCKWAFVADYDAGNIKIFLNGSLVKTDTSINLSRFGLGRISLSYLSGMTQYEQLLTIPTAISNEEAIALTTI